jgi:hypothetical protein
MNRLSAYCYSLSAIAMACIIGTVSAPGYWEGRGFSGFMLGLAVPACVLSAWLLEHKPIRRPARFYHIAGYAGMVIGSVAILIFISSISRHLATGLAAGLALALFGAQFLDHQQPK